MGIQKSIRRLRRVRKNQSETRNRALVLQVLEDRTLLANGQWYAVFEGMAPGTSFAEQTQYGRNLLGSAGASVPDIRVMEALDMSGTFLLQAPTDMDPATLTSSLQQVPGFLYASEYDQPEPKTFRDTTPARGRSEGIYGTFNYDAFLSREKNGEFANSGGLVDSGPLDSLTNNNSGNTGTASFTQSETGLVAFGNTVVIGFNDSGSNSGGTNKFTGFAYSTDGGATFTDGGTLPTNTIGDAGDPVLARDETTGRIYFSTLGFSAPGTIQVFRSDDNGVTWSAPVNGTPGGSSEDKEWMAVDNYPGPGNGNVYLLSRRFGTGPGIYFFRSTDQGATFGPSGGTLIVSGNQGAFVTVGPDHSIYAFWWAGTTLQMRKSTNGGVSFGAPITVASGLTAPGSNGDLGLTGLRQGTATFASFRSNSFPHAAVNPVSGHIYVTFNDNPAGTDKGDVYMVMSTDGGATWSARVRVNEDVTTTDQWQPTLAVSTDGSRLGIFYYSRQEDPVSNNLFKYYGRLATISGSTVTFLPSSAISDVASLPEFGRDSLVNSTYMSDYDFAAATPGYFHVTWSDNREDLPGGAPRKDPNVYYDKIPLGLAVTTTIPAVGSVVTTPPTTFTVNVTDPIDPSTIDASDFNVQGIGADSYSYTPGTTTVVFSYTTSPVTTEGLQMMHISAGAFARDGDGNPVIQFDGPFRYDTVLLQVISTVPPFPNGVFTLPTPFSYDLNFNELVNPLSVQASDLLLSGIGGAFVSGVTVLPGDTTARFTIGGITTEGSLTASILAGAITDASGNPGAAFSATYQVDISTVPYPTPLAAKAPAGSLVYDPTFSGVINFAGDVDNFTIAIDPDQVVTVLVTPTSSGLQPSVELRDPTSTLLGSASAAAAGQNALLQTVPTTVGGTYTISVAGVGGTIGNYTVQVTLNAALELEGTISGATNNTLGTAQDIGGSFITLKTAQASAQRGAVLGTTDFAGYSAAAVPFAFEDISATGTVIAALTNADDSATTITPGFTFPFFGTSFSSFGVSTNGLITFAGTSTTFTNTNLTTTPTLATIAPFWDDLHTAGGTASSNVFFQVLGSGTNQHLTLQWNNIRFFSGGTAGDTITFEAQLFADGRIQFNYSDLVSGAAAGNNGASATVGVKAAGTQGPNRLLLAFNSGPNAFVGSGQSTLVSPPNPTPDIFAFSMSTNDVATLAVKGLSAGTVNLDLLDAGGVVLASGIGGSTNLDKVISNFVISTTGTYYARITGSSLLPFDLVVTRNSALDTEANDSFAVPQPIAGNQGGLGAIAPGNVYIASAVPFGFEDISATGTVISALANVDDVATTITPGFTFTFFGSSFSSFGVSSNGLITFGGTDSTFTNTDLTTTPTLASIAVFWDDLHTGGGAANSGVRFQVLGSGSSQRLVIQWNEIRFFSGGTAGDTITFQVALVADGSVRFNYLDLVSGAAAGNNGASATVGIKAAGTQGPNRILLSFNSSSTPFVGTGKSSLITLPPSNDFYSIDVTSTANALRIETSTPGDGPGEPVNNLNPQIELYDSSNSLVASGVPLSDGINEFISVLPSTTGTYRLRVMGEAGSLGNYFFTKNFSPVLTNVAVTTPIFENGTATLTGTINDPDLRDSFTLVVNWGEGAPESFGYQAGTTNFRVSHQYLDDDPTATASDIYSISLTVTDNHGASGTAGTTLTVDNVNPVATALSNSSPECGGTTEGSAMTISGSFTDVGTLDTHEASINWGDGNTTPGTVSESSGSGSVSATHVYANGGIYTIAMTVTDDDTGVSNVVTTTAYIIGVGVNGGVLQVIGSNNADHVSINAQSNGFRVHADFLPSGSFKDVSSAGVTKILVFLCGGDDQAQISGAISTAAILDGGSGGDTLNGGGGTNIILGGPGPDMLIGGNSRDILIGGEDADRIVGNAGDDILIGGRTIYDSNYAALDKIMEEWNSGDEYPLRVDHLRGIVPGGANGFYFLNSSTVLDDGAVDRMTGSAGSDWFLGNLSQDEFSDQGKGELDN